MRNIFVISVFLLCLSFLFPGKILANSEVIQRFDSKITAHKDGSFDVLETIEYDFGDNARHGIYRDIPTTSRVGDLYRQSKINVINVERDNENENYAVTDNNNQISVKIGRANQTITGLHTYSISYVVQNGIGSNYADHDEIYWNVTGNGWQIPILKTSAELTTDFGISPNKTICYSGVQGSTSQGCTPGTLAPGEGLTEVWGFDKGTFPPSILSTRSPVQNNLYFLIFLALALVVFLNFILAPGLLIWYLRHKRKNRFGPVTVNFDLPKTKTGMRIAPAEAGIINNAKLEKDDVVAIIFDLAIRKYIKIVNKEKDSSFLGIHKKSTELYIEKVKNQGKDPLIGYERQLYNRFFQAGDSVKIASLSSNFYLTFDILEQLVFSSLTEKGYYTKNPKTQMVLLLIAGIFVIFAGGILLGPLLIYLSRKLNGRTASGDEMDWKIDGLKLFLKNMSREHTWYAKNLIIVEKYIPYAIALGYIKEFMDQLKIIYPNYKPNWYSGNMAFYAVSSSMFSSMNSSFVAAPSSSGFSGGGFSGGGGGGGGGGSW